MPFVARGARGRERGERQVRWATCARRTILPTDCGCGGGGEVFPASHTTTKTISMQRRTGPDFISSHPHFWPALSWSTYRNDSSVNQETGEGALVIWHQEHGGVDAWRRRGGSAALVPVRLRWRQSWRNEGLARARLNSRCRETPSMLCASLYQRQKWSRSSLGTRYGTTVV